MNYNNRIIELKKKALESSCTKEELNELYYLISRFGSASELEELLQAGWDADQPGDRLNEKSSQEILTGIRSSINKKQKRSFVFRRTMQIAATISLLAIFFFVLEFYNQTQSAEVTMIKQETGIGEVKKMVLEDGTVLWLNANSSITYLSSFKEDKRVVRLQGEAFFDVARDEKRPFVIQSGEFFTEVLGTSFNITSYREGNYAATVSTGKVKVNISQQSVLLTKNQQTEYSTAHGKFISKNVDAGDFSGWRFGVTRLNGRLEEAVEVLERRYGVKFLFENPQLESYEIDATYKNESLENILKSIEFSMGVNIKHQKDTIKISKSVINN